MMTFSPSPSPLFYIFIITAKSRFQFIHYLFSGVHRRWCDWNTSVRTQSYSRCVRADTSEETPWNFFFYSSMSYLFPPLFFFFSRSFTVLTLYVSFSLCPSVFLLLPPILLFMTAFPFPLPFILYSFSFHLLLYHNSSQVVASSCVWVSPSPWLREKETSARKLFSSTSYHVMTCHTSFRMN